jgi:hypothetical protein
MGKDKSKKKDSSKKKGKAAAEEFPAAAAPGADEAATPSVDTDSLTKKEKKRIAELSFGEVHDFTRGVEQLYRVHLLNEWLREDPKKKTRKLIDAELQGYRDRGTALMYEKLDGDKKAREDAKTAKAAEPEPTKPELDVAPEVDEEVEAIRARVNARRQERYEKAIADGATEEAARQMSRFTALRDEDPKGLTLGEVGAKIMTAAIDPEEDRATLAAELDAAEPEGPKKVSSKKKGKKAASEPEPVKHEAEVVETEKGREFAVGTAKGKDEDLDPKDADRDADGVRWSKHASPRPYIFVPGGDEKLYTRMTSYIDVLDSKDGLYDWKDRMLLIGAARAAAELDPDLDSVDIIGKTNELVALVESSIATADKKLKKGKVSVREHAELVADAEKAYKAEVRKLVDDMRDRGGAHDAAQKGTDLHKVFEDFDNAHLAAKGKLTVDEWLLVHPYEEDGPTWGETLTPADIADLRAYRAAVEAEGIEVIACEQRVVLDEFAVTGTLDRSIRFTPPGATRKVKGVGDVKTGRLDYGAGKFACQVYGYAIGEGYANSEERVDLKHSKKWGVIFHSPAGQAKTTIYYLDLSKGIEGWKLIAAVRDWRRSTTETQTFRGKAPYLFAGATAEMSEDGAIVVTHPDSK